MHFRIANRNNRGGRKVFFSFLCCLFYFFLGIPSLGLAVPAEKTELSVPVDDDNSESLSAPVTQKELLEIKTLLGDHLEEWNKMRPVLQRLVKSEQDLASIVAALDGLAPLPSQPNEQQLLDPQVLRLPDKAVVIKPKREVKNQTELSRQTSLAQVKQLELPLPKNVKIGIHLASYKQNSHVARGWEVLVHNFKKQLTGKTPFYYQLPVGDTLFIRLIAGDFSSQSAAQQVCNKLKSEKQYCQVIHYKITIKK